MTSHLFLKNRICKWLLFICAQASGLLIKEILFHLMFFFSFEGQAYLENQCKPSKGKCEIAGFSALKQVSITLFGKEFHELTSEAIKILGINFYYDEQIENKENFIKHIIKIEKSHLP